MKNHPSGRFSSENHPLEAQNLTGKLVITSPLTAEGCCCCQELDRSPRQEETDTLTVLPIENRVLMQNERTQENITSQDKARSNQTQAGQAGKHARHAESQECELAAGCCVILNPGHGTVNGGLEPVEPCPHVQ